MAAKVMPPSCRTMPDNEAQEAPKGGLEGGARPPPDANTARLQQNIKPPPLSPPKRPQQSPQREHKLQRKDIRPHSGIRMSASTATSATKSAHVDKLPQGKLPHLSSPSCKHG